MKVQCEVETNIWRAARVFSLENGETMGGVVTSALKEFLQDRVGPVVGNRRERSSVASSSKSSVTRRAAMEEKSDGSARPVQQTGDAIKGGSTPSTPATPEVVTPMAKCRKCGDSFPVADMVTEPKSGKLFCGDCVENLKNGQA